MSTVKSITLTRRLHGVGVELKGIVIAIVIAVVIVVVAVAIVAVSGLCKGHVKDA